MYFVLDFYLPQGFKRAQVRIWFLVTLIRRLFKRGRKLFKKNSLFGGAAISCTQAKSRWRIKAHNWVWGLHLFEWCFFERRCSRIFFFSGYKRCCRLQDSNIPLQRGLKIYPTRGVWLKIWRSIFLEKSIFKVRKKGNSSRTLKPNTDLCWYSNLCFDF